MKMWEFVRATQRRMRTQSISCKSKPSALTKPVRHWRRFIGVGLFKVWKVFANNEANVVKEPGKEGGLYCPYISFNGRDDWTFKDVDETNIPIPPTYEEVTAAPKFKNVRFKSTNHRDEDMFFWFLKLRGLYFMYRIWTACNILGIKAEQFRGASHLQDIGFVS